MCWRLEFGKDYGSAKNRMTCCRLTLNIIGLIVILIIGAIAATFASFSTEWFPTSKYNDGVYKAIASKDARVMMLTEEDVKDCTNATDASRMVGRYVFKCGSGKVGTCLPMDQRCNGYVDCEEDESDELTCDDFCDKASRRKVRFRCKARDKEDEIVEKCFHSSYKCDGEIDCTAEAEDNNDEASCEDTIELGLTGAKCSKDHSFVCADNKLCLREGALCDGFEDCWDGSDEDDCD